MGETNRRKATDPNYGRPRSDQRGLIVSLAGVMLAPLIAGKTDDEASVLVGTLSEVAKIMAALPLATAACH